MSVPAPAPVPPALTVTATVTPTQDFRAEAPWFVEAAGSRLTPFLTATAEGLVQINYASSASSSHPTPALLRVGEDDVASTGWAPLAEVPLGSWADGSYASRVIQADGSDAVALWSANWSGPGGLALTGTDPVAAPDGFFEVVGVDASTGATEPVQGTATGTSPLLATRRSLYLPPGNRLILENPLLLGGPLQVRDMTTLQASRVAGIPLTWSWYQPLPSHSAVALYLACLSSPSSGPASLFTVSVCYDSSEPDWPWVLAQGDPICDEHFSPATCGSVVDWGGGSIEAVMLDAPGDGSTAPRLVTVKGVLDAAAGTPPGWEPATVTPVDLPTTLLATALWTVPGADELLIVVQGYVTDSVGTHSQLWMIGRDQQSATWKTSVMLDSGAKVLDVLAHVTGLSLLVQRDGAHAGGPVGYELWRHNDDGGWEVSFVDLEAASASATESQGYRIGIRARHDDAVGSDAAAELTVSSSESVRCTIDADPALLHQTGRVLRSTGTTWITIPLVDGLSAPTLTVSAAGLATPLVIHPAADVQKFLAAVTSAELGAAVDPRTQTAVLKPSVSADDVSALIRQTMSLAADPSSPAPDPAWTCWEMDAAGTVTTLTPDQAVERREVLLAAPRPGPDALAVLRPHAHLTPLSIFDDIWDALSDCAAAVWHGIVEVTGIVIKGVSAAITLIIDGVTYAIDAVVDSVHKALDVITYIMDRAGAAVGALVGWLLSKLGFLFDWDALKVRRDSVRTLLRGAVTATPTLLPDPAVAAGTLAAEIASGRQAMDQWFASLGASPAGATTLAAAHQQTSKPSELESTVESAVTWLIDKATNALTSQIPLLAGPDIDGLGPAARTAMTGLDTAATAIGSTLSDFTSTAIGLLAAPDTLLDRPFEDLLALVQSDLDVAFDGVGDAITGGGDFCHLLWANPGKVVDWLDTPLPPSYFTGFYRGLTGQPPSVFELLCMAVAICWPAGAQSVAAQADELVDATAVSAGSWTALQIAAEVLGSVGVVTVAAATFTDLESGGKAPWLSALNTAITIARVHCVLHDTDTDQNVRYVIYAGDCAAALVGLLYLIPAVRARVSQGPALERRTAATMAVLAVLIYQLVKSPSGPTLAVGITSIVQQLHALGAVVGQYEAGGGAVQAPMNPEGAAICAGFQAVCSALNVGFYAWAISSGPAHAAVVASGSV